MSEFNKILQDKLLDYQVLPPESVFDKIKYQYPKKTFSEYISHNKYYFIAGISIILISILLLLSIYRNTQDSLVIKEKSELKKENTPRCKNTKYPARVLPLVGTKKVANADNKLTKNRSYGLKEDSVILDKQELCFFETKDTSICGDLFIINKSISKSNLLIPENLIVEEVSGKTLFKCTSSGIFRVYYIENDLKDSLQIEFVNLTPSMLGYSKDTLCYNESLEMFIDDEKVDLMWEIEKFETKAVDKNKYIISGLAPGDHRLDFYISQGGCRIKCNKQIFVEKDLAYRYTITKNTCSRSNASLIIEADASKVNLYSLNNLIYSNYGKFEKLNSGIYFLDIKYGNGCLSQDTIIILDSLSVYPFFEISKDETIKNRYFFKNVSLVDGEEALDGQLSYQWIVNGEIVSRAKNLEIDLSSKYKNEIELEARLNENCYSRYSESLFLSEGALKIPNIFTPNGDGIGDEFKIYYEESVYNFNIKIYSKIGEIIFESVDINKSWDGRINNSTNHAGEGLYYYTIKWESKFGNKHIEKGVVSLVR